MERTKARSIKRGIGKSLVALLVACGLLLLSAFTVLASSVDLHDDAGVLNTSRVRNEASTLPYPIRIYTENYAGSNQQFIQVVRSKVTGSNVIVLAINTHGFVYADGGKQVPLNNSQYTTASQAFSNDYRSSRDYTSATLASIHSLQDMLNTRSNGGGFLPGGGNALTNTFCCIGLLIIIGIAFFAIMRARSRRGGIIPPQAPYNPPPPPQSPYQGYQQGGYPPNYGPGYPPNYGPGYPQNQGINPLAAGGLGAAAGGFLGYELGKERGEREAREDMGGGYYDNSGFGGGFGGGDAGGGGSSFDPGNGGSDFGGGGSDFGGGGSDFGGG
ncbi:MAG TPA: hypothetical protein VKX46_11625, partial [Ktedonobacteraceae bacterium]|nr:hypothetical protein [Ktedonobacteraceae bacterium]